MLFCVITRRRFKLIAGYQPQRNASSLPALAVSARRDNGSRSGAAGAGAAGAAPLGVIWELVTMYTASARYKYIEDYESTNHTV